jgi:hypothetical protein
MPPGELRRFIMGDEPKGETPEWIVLDGEVRALLAKLKADVATAVERFRGYADVRDAISYRERQVPRLEKKVEEVNVQIRLLNLHAPMRFTRSELDAQREVAPLAKAYFRRA